jgi:integrase
MSDTSDQPSALAAPAPWNKGRLVGQKPPLKLQEIWAIRIRLELGKRVRELALFNLAIDSKLRGCDLVGLRVRDVAHGDHVMPRATVIQQKTGRPVRFELTDQTREAVGAWITSQHLLSGSFLFPSWNRRDRHLSTRQYARIVQQWVALIGLDPTEYGTHSLRRTKATLIYRRTKNLRAVQLLLGHTKLDYLPSRTISRCARPRDRHQPAVLATGHSFPDYRPLRNASSRSSGRHRPGLPLGGVVLSRTSFFKARLASK